MPSIKGRDSGGKSRFDNLKFASAVYADLAGTLDRMEQSIDRTEPGALSNFRENAALFTPQIDTALAILRRTRRDDGAVRMTNAACAERIASAARRRLDTFFSKARETAAHDIDAIVEQREAKQGDRPKNTKAQSDALAAKAKIIQAARAQAIADNPNLEGKCFALPFEFVLTGDRVRVLSWEERLAPHFKKICRSLEAWQPSYDAALRRQFEAKQLKEQEAVKKAATSNVSAANVIPFNKDQSTKPKKEYDFDVVDPEDAEDDKERQKQFRDVQDVFKDPVDLWASFDPPELPEGLLPKLIDEYARITSDTMGVDAGGVAMAALAVCASVIPDSIKLKMKKHSDGWKESARIWVALIGEPSTKKSPIISATKKPVEALEAKALAAYNEELAYFLAEPEKDRNPDDKPHRTRHLLDNTTLEAAQDALRYSPNGLALIVDEMSGWLANMDKYGGGKSGGAADRGYWLSAYNGVQLPVDRVQRGAFMVPNWSVCFLGGVQPSVIRSIAGQSYDDGLLQRMLTIRLRPGRMGKDEPSPAIEDDYFKTVECLAELEPPSPLTDYQHLNETIGCLRFDDEAQELRNQLEAKHLQLTHIQSINKKLAGFVGKLDGLFGRLCVIWHCLEHVHDKKLPHVVTIGTAQRVADFIDRFLLPHAMSFYAGELGLSDDHDTLTNVAGYILAHNKSVMTFRDMQRGNRVMRGLKQRETIDIYDQLEALGWLRREIDYRRGRKKTDEWVVNPKLSGRFAERAKRERLEREAARALIIAKVATKEE